MLDAQTHPFSLEKRTLQGLGWPLWKLLAICHALECFGSVVGNWKGCSVSPCLPEPLNEPPTALLTKLTQSAAPRAPQEMLKHSSISVSVGSLGPGVYKVCLTLLASLVGMGFDSKCQFGSGQGSEEPKAFSWPNLYLHSDMRPPREPFSFNSY